MMNNRLYKPNKTKMADGVCSEQLVCGGSLWAAASYLFFADCHFHLRENKTTETEEKNDGQQAL